MQGYPLFVGEALFFPDFSEENCRLTASPYGDPHAKNQAVPERRDVKCCFESAVYPDQLRYRPYPAGVVPQLAPEKERSSHISFPHLQ